MKAPGASSHFTHNFSSLRSCWRGLLFSPAGNHRSLPRRAAQRLRACSVSSLITLFPRPHRHPCNGFVIVSGLMNPQLRRATSIDSCKSPCALNHSHVLVVQDPDRANAQLAAVTSVQPRWQRHPPASPLHKMYSRHHLHDGSFSLKPMLPS